MIGFVIRHNRSIFSRLTLYTKCVFRRPSLRCTQYEMILLHDNFLLTCLGSVHCSKLCSTTPDEDLTYFYIWRIGGHDQIDQIISIDDSIQIPPEAFDYKH